MQIPLVISLFCGTGGSSLGYKWAGFKEILAIDQEPHAVECFKLNFPEVPVWERDIKNVGGKEILEYCKIKKGELDVLDGSPPCQGFSTAGKREVSDSRNDLFKHYVRLINELEPKVFVMENVTGMIKGKMKGKFIEIMKTLKELNYNVKCKKMNSMYYGVPQSRERLIFIGVRKDLNKEPIYPIPSKDIISVKEALKNIKPNKIRDPFPSTINALKKTRPGEQLSKHDEKGNFFNYSRVPIDKPTNTVCKTTPNLFHFKGNRFLDINEVCVLCSFPENWQLGDNFGKAWARLGNAVMPKFMQAIAETIRVKILNSND